MHLLHQFKFVLECLLPCSLSDPLLQILNFHFELLLLLHVGIGVHVEQLRKVLLLLMQFLFEMHYRQHSLVSLIEQYLQFVSLLK